MLMSVWSMQYLYKEENKMNILMATSEANPYAKTGGLADVLGSLPKELNKQGADVRVIMPKYGTISQELKDQMEHIDSFTLKMGWRNQYCGIEQAKYNGVIYYFIDNEFYFKREGYYGYGDDGERFAFFCRAVLEVIPKIGFIPDILHCHEWHTGMIPVILEAHYRGLENYSNIETVFTIHNLKYQGIFGIEAFKEWFDLGDEYFTPDKLELYNGASFMKGGLVYSKTLTTVSKSYADEIRYPFYGEKLDGLLNARQKDLYGIINGVDYDEFNPKKDNYIYHAYSKSRIKGKIENKLALQQELNLNVGEEIPMIGLISRLVDQKGLDLIAHVLEELLQEDVQLVILGTGDEMYESIFKNAAINHPGKVSANICFDNELAHKIYAASDLFLMPSLFEPCGLGQLISLRYGTLPIVRETGGLKDTVVAFNEETEEGNGFTFANYNAHDMLFTIKRSLELYKRKTVWKKLQKAAMSCDYSWEASSEKYLDLYHTIKSKTIYSEEKNKQL